MFKKTYWIFLALGLTSCVTKESVTQSPVGPGFQTEIYKNSQLKQVFAICETVLTSEGFSLKDSNISLGFITAQKSLDPDDYFKGISLLRNNVERNAKKVVIDASVQVVQMKRDTKIRLSLVRKLVNSSGEVTAAHTLTELEPYKEMLSKFRTQIEKK